MDGRQYAPATQRNREPILEILLRVLPPEGNILEIASGTGEHAAFFAPHIAPRCWIPSDPDPQLRESIAAWQNYFQLTNLHSPLDIDAAESRWAIEDKEIKIQALVNINMIHIAPWSTCLGLIAGANRLLPSGGILYLYGPFKQGGKHTAPSNLTFDQFLRSQNSQWGVRDLDEVVAVAKSNNLELQETFAMPANNLSVVFQHQ
ncbi:DUF938 domain-containing protein [Pleurocapsales cyanobacterium LEGE 06147]|nr:DUF938 domain-containing protein [Pleurocapsales cyanobacterium LEGE 06147]